MDLLTCAFDLFQVIKSWVYLIYYILGTTICHALAPHGRPALKSTA